MRTFIAVALSTTLFASAAFAADSAGPLAAGKPAGVKHAQEVGSTTLWVLVGVGVLAAVAIGVASSSNGSPTGAQNLVVTPVTTI
jgi:hypothetical protein